MRAAKKPGAAKTTAKTTAKRTVKNTKVDRPAALVCAADHECFWTTDGRVLKDLNDLQNALATMADPVFGYHVSAQKNDFAEWVEHVLLDAACANDLRSSRKPSTARAVVVRHIRTYHV